MLLEGVVRRQARQGWNRALQCLANEVRREKRERRDEEDATHRRQRENTASTFVLLIVARLKRPTPRTGGGRHQGSRGREKGAARVLLVKTLAKEHVGWGREKSRLEPTCRNDHG